MSATVAIVIVVAGVVVVSGGVVDDGGALRALNPYPTPPRSPALPSSDGDVASGMAEIHLSSLPPPGDVARPSYRRALAPLEVITESEPTVLQGREPLKDNFVAMQQRRNSLGAPSYPPPNPATSMGPQGSAAAVLFPMYLRRGSADRIPVDWPVDDNVDYDSDTDSLDGNDAVVVPEPDHEPVPERRLKRSYSVYEGPVTKPLPNPKYVLVRTSSSPTNQVPEPLVELAPAVTPSVATQRTRAVGPVSNVVPEPDVHVPEQPAPAPPQSSPSSTAVPDDVLRPAPPKPMKLKVWGKLSHAAHPAIAGSVALIALLSRHLPVPKEPIVHQPPVSKVSVAVAVAAGASVGYAIRQRAVSSRNVRHRPVAFPQKHLPPPIKGNGNNLVILCTICVVCAVLVSIVLFYFVSWSTQFPRIKGVPHDPFVFGSSAPTDEPPAVIIAA
ncbi:Uncharacterized protein PBTT_00913 [Plasmodiophora brassicae]|uniref:Uncharacterized protein n=1 Tax=Plasmodiophora brassicae TaxID=37360 RepID=A0A0G4IUT4_PLABS|nr:hypothetical protein PBRA_007008 [Plasmodiophora brassicae]SPQ92964.1 unnamed protein product [Plasmodiophora brassicae]